MSSAKHKKYTDGIFLEQTELVGNLFNAYEQYPDVIEWWAVAPEIGRLLAKQTTDCVVIDSVLGTWVGLYSYKITIDCMVEKALQRF
ncbi:hypothetical protein H0A36_29120 [Endozoicomonas sp. SM1973]|uniref:Uncharacterized protein n=1 Tax=Spartinivicinus marinus TaxID=2994442 RepID=A0A853I862_9GAMM|nr:hypothetical protein [Spartinivicinus marinus]MCX4025613.1 hypothetical protein [Spartinivicinus marinus]NYZ70080.1 hypothetical protein [Spartinivicinus marinus]